MWSQPDGSAVVELCSKEQYEKFTTLTTLDNAPVKHISHPSFNTCVGVIKAHWLSHCSDDALFTGFELEKQRVKHVYHPTKMVNGLRVPTDTLILTFDHLSLPVKVIAGWHCFEVSPYVRRPRRCFKCQRFGHAQKACRRPTVVCVTCSLEHNAPHCPNAPHCANCRGAHAASSSSCPRYLYECEVLNIRDTEHVSFEKARVKASVRQVQPGGQTFA